MTKDRDGVEEQKNINSPTAWFDMTTATDLIRHTEDRARWRKMTAYAYRIAHI